ncbi:hypothetical protein GCM10010174_62840 [Kutzneria viridogrisea]|uniref:Glycopeptide antibiotics resistance protein n=1 Tax=Kutzneria viridogrisea TaxID=47990 RepID=A0ABR6BFZ8_9PSEU|nr:glycopeptide antibiotics resistance protein [Kutzneria viridogrisea]
MEIRVIPGIIAVAIGFLLATLLLVPYIIWSYRRRGEIGLGHAVLGLGVLVYAVALWTYTLLPLPADLDAQWCAKFATTPQLHPLRFVAEAQKYPHDSVAALLRNPEIQGFLFNIALFVPLGMFARHVFHRGVLPTVIIGFLTSLLIECTQLTGNWFLFPCSYRLFDVDDLLSNTLGAVIGVALAPVLHLVPGQRVSAPPDQPRKVTVRRRWLGMALDVAAVSLLGATIVVVVAVLAEGRYNIDQHPLMLALASAWAPAVLLLLVIPLLGDGGTIGQRIVLLRPAGRGGGKPPVWRMLIRFLAGSGGYFGLLGWGLVNEWGELLAAGLLVVSGLAAWFSKGHRGLSGAIAGLRLADARTRVAGDPTGKVSVEERQ